MKEGEENMKKVLYVTTVSRTINAFLIPHINMLLDNGYEVHCACSIDKPVDKELQRKGVKDLSDNGEKNLDNPGTAKTS